MASADHRVILISKLSEKLASKGLDTDIIDELLEVESKSLRKLADLDVVNLPGEVRLFVLHFVYHLYLSSPNGSTTCYFQAVQTFDLASKQALDSDSSLSSMIALAAAAWLVSAKMLSQGPHMTIEQVAAQAEVFAGFPVMTCGDVQEKEETLLLSFNISAPTLCTWYDLFSARLDAIFDGALQKSGHLQHMQMAYLKVLSVAMHSVEVSAKCPAYMIAAGSFCFALAVTGLLPVAEVIQPSAIAATQNPDNASIDAKLARFSQCCRCEDLPASPVPVPALLAAMQVALHCSRQSMLLATTILVVST